MEKLSQSVIITGEICSGKSTLAKQLSEKFGIPIASFGKYLYQTAQQENLPLNRESLQNLGDRLVKKNPSEFLFNVMEFSQPESICFIFEGVRHIAIFDLIKLISVQTASIYLDIGQDRRLERFLARSKKIDQNLNEEDFFKRSNHPVEKEIKSIQPLCEFCFQQNYDISKLLINKSTI